MTSEVPPEFDKPWSMSDVVLKTNNSDGKEIHSCKAALAMFSPYFRALFFGDFKEKNDSSVNVDCDYDVMLAILQNIHQINFEYAVGQKPYSSEMIVRMYGIADRFDFAFIRKLCLDQMKGYPSVEMAKAAHALENFDLRMSILSRLTREEVNKFLHDPDIKYILSKEEFLILFKKLVGVLPQSTELRGKLLNLEEITEDLENPRVDLTKPWPGADLAITTVNARGRLLFASKTVVEMMCLGFHKYLRPTDELLLEGPNMFTAHIPEEYIAVKEILSIIHMCNNDFRKDRILHPALLHDMYFASLRDRLDILMIRRLCLAKLIEHKSVDAVDALSTLSVDKRMREALEMLSSIQLRDWIYRRGGHLGYHDGQMKVSSTHGQEIRFIDRELTCWLIQKFKEHFFP